MASKTPFLKKSLLSASLGVAIFGLSVPILASPIIPLASSSSSSSIPYNDISSVMKIDFNSSDYGAGRLTIEFDGNVSDDDTKLYYSEKEIKVDMKNVLFPREMINAPPMDVSDFNTPVQMVFVTQKDSSSNPVLHLRLSGKHKTPNVFQSGDKYVLEISPWLDGPIQPSIVETAPEKTTGVNTDVTSFAMPKTRNEKVEDTFDSFVVDEKPQVISAPVVSTAVKDDPIAPVAKASAVQRASNSNLSIRSTRKASSTSTLSQPVYTGNPVTFNFQDVPVRTILQLIAEESQFNIVAADTVQGSVTLRLDGVPWDQALDTLLRAQGLDKRQQGNVIWVAPQQEIASYEKAREEARIAMDNSEDLATEYIQINYHNAKSIFDALIGAQGISASGSSEGQSSSSSADTGFMSPRGRIVVDERTNTLMVSDIPRKIDEMKELLQIIDRPVDQVLIEARVVVATESFARELGTRFGGRVGIDNVVVGGDYFSNNAVSNPLGSIGLSFLNAGNRLDLEFSAMEKEGRGEVISNPRVVTTNQREAIISQGREVGYVTMTGAAGATATPNVEFKDVLLEMKVTPTITQDGRVFLDMNVKKDEILSMIDTSMGVVPEISKRQINTAVLVGDGQTVVVGGVYEINDANDISKVPFFGDIPFLGNLFKKRGRSKEKAELLVFITPRVLRVAPPSHLVQAPVDPDVSHVIGNK